MRVSPLLVDLVLCFVHAAGGECTTGLVYELYELGAELGIWPPRTRRQIRNALLELARQGRIEKRLVSFGRYGATSMIRATDGCNELLLLLAEDLLGLKKRIEEVTGKRGRARARRP